MGEILVSQELVQVEYSTRFPFVLVTQELVQVEYTVRPSDTGSLGAEIFGSYVTEPEYTYVKSTHEFEDFDVQVDFTICSGVDTTMCGVEVVFEIDTNNKFYMRAGSFLGNQAFMCNFIDGEVNNFYTVSGTNAYGKLRISRYVNNVTVYYKDGSDSNWVIWKNYDSFSVSSGNVLLGFYSGGSFDSLVTLDNFKVNFERGCLTCYFFDNFYGIDGDLYNQFLWTGSTSNIRIYNNKLHMTYGNTDTYVDTKYAHKGDFNVQVDFSIGSYQTSEGLAQYLRVYFENGDNFYIRYGYTSSGPIKRYGTDAYINGAWTSYVYYNSDVMSGKLRIIKEGKRISSYCLINNTWVMVGSYCLEEDTNLSYIKLYKSSWTNYPNFECYFDNFVINDDFDFYNDVVIDGDYSYVDGNYIKLEGGNVRTNKVIRSANAITFEWSVIVEDYSSNYSAGFVVCNTPFRSGYSDHSGESIYIMYYTDSFRLYVDGYAYNYILDGDNRLFYPVYGKPYIINVKFIPGTGTVICWQGPTNGYLVLDYIINGDLYAWCGNQYGRGDYGTQVSRVCRFRCFEDSVLYKELKNNWSLSIGANDEFNASEGSSPDSERWIISGDPKIYSNSLKIISTNEDKIQSKTFFCAPFEIILDYNNLSFSSIEGLALSLNVEAYDNYKDTIFGVSKFKVGYSGGVAAWVNYYCSDSSGNSSIYHISDVSNRKLKIINDGYNIQYFLSDNSDWITILSQDCNRQYYYKVSVEGADPNIIAYLDSITIDSEEFMTPTDAVALVPTTWKFSPTDKAYQDITHINLNELVDRCRHFSIDAVVKIDDSMFLSYIEMDKDLVNFDGAKVVGDNYVTLTSAMDATSDGEIIYVLPGTYSLGGYTINKKIIVVGVGDYRDINIVISGSSVKLDGCEIIFKNVNILEQLPADNIAFRTQGDNVNYFTIDNCKYTSSNNSTEIFKIEGTKTFYVYMRKSYINHNGFFAYTASGYPDIHFDIFNCRILRTPSNICSPSNGYKIRSMIYSNSSLYEPKVIDTIPVLILFSPNKDTNIYLNTPKGLEKTITSKENEFNYLSFGNTPGGIAFYGGSNDYYFSEYFMPPVDNSFRLFIQGYIDTIRVFDRYQTYSETLNNINTVDNLGINLKLAHNSIIVDYKIYEPLNIYNSGLYLGRNTSSIIDEFIWSKAENSSSDLLLCYYNYLGKLGYLNCDIGSYSTQYKFFIDFGSTIGVGSLIQSQAHNFLHTMYYSDDTDDPSLVETACSLYDARWYVLSNDISYNASSLTPGVFSVFPTVSGCDESRWEYSGEYGYIDLVPNSVLSVGPSLTDVYNIKWKRNKTNINDYMISSFSDSLTISLKLFGGGTCNRIVIKSGYDIGIEYTGYITKCSIVIDGVTRFNIEDNINSIIVAEFDSVSFTTIDLIIQEVKQTPEFFFNGTYLTGNVAFINYVKVLSSSTTRKFDDTLCNVYELEAALKLDSIDTSKTGTCSLNYYSSNQFMDGCVLASSLDLSNLPSNNFVSVLAVSDNLYDCGFIIDEYVVDVPAETMTGSMDSWKIYTGDAELYEEFFYIQGTSTSIGVRFFKNTVFEIGTYHEQFGVNDEWAVTDELVLRIYSVNNIDNFYLCIGDKEDGRYYRWDFSLVSGWNNLRLNFYDSKVTKYVFNVLTDNLLFNDLDIFNVWFGGTYLHESGILVLDNIFVDRSSIKNVLSSRKDSFYIPVYFESNSGSVQLDYTTYWGSDGKIFGNILSDKVLLTLLADELVMSLVNTITGEFILKMYSYRHGVRTKKTFGRAHRFDINNKIKLKLSWYSKGGCFWSELYINGFLIGRIQFNLIEITELKVTAVMIGGSGVNVGSQDVLSLCGEVKNIKIYSNNIESEVTNDTLIINGKNLVENSPLYIGEIEPSKYIKLPIYYRGKSKDIIGLNLKIRWLGNY